jgi:hypothetical protein
MVSCITFQKHIQLQPDDSVYNDVHPVTQFISVGDPLCNYLPLSGDGARRPIKTKLFAQEWHMSCQSAAGVNTPAVTASTAHKPRTHAGKPIH